MEEKFGMRRPADIENRSFEIIRSECKRPHEEDTAPVLYRVIHTTADFDYEDNLVFSEGVMERALAAICRGTTFVTDTNMGLAGINKAALKKMNCEAVCFMADAEVARLARERGTTRAAVSMEVAAKRYPDGIYAIGNAPTALIRLYEMLEEAGDKTARDGGFSPALIIGVPVGFVNVVEAKELILKADVPHIVARGRKGGSSVAAAICNALLYTAGGR